jgi:hypothetical protein
MERSRNGVLLLWNGYKVNVVGHEAIGPNAKKESDARSTKQIEIAKPIFVVPEHVRATNTSVGNVVWNSRSNNTGDTWHEL